MPIEVLSRIADHKINNLGDLLPRHYAADKGALKTQDIPLNGAEFAYTLALAFLCIGGSLLLSLGAYYLGRMTLPSRADKESKDLASSVVVRIAALHSLVLALVFAQELINWNEVRRSVSREAAIVGDVFYDLKRFDRNATEGIRKNIATYVSIVIDKEWPKLASEQLLDDAAWALWEKSYLAILDLETRPGRRAQLKPILVRNIRELSSLRLSRQNAAQIGLNGWFLAAALVGVVLTSLSYFNFAPNGVTLTLLGIFGSYTGIILFFIVVFANPYQSPGNVPPKPFEQMYVGEVRELASQALK